MAYCPVALMEDIRGNSSGIGPDNYSGGDGGTMRVQFPTLLSSPTLPHPPTDSDTTASSSTMAATTAAEEGSSTLSQRDDDVRRQQQDRSHRCSGGDSGGERGSVCGNSTQASQAEATAAPSSSKAATGNDDADRTPSLSENGPLPLQSSSNGRRVSERTSSTSDDDDDEMEIDELDFALQSDPVGMIKSALNKLVVRVKRRKVRLAEQAKKKQQGGSDKNGEAHRAASPTSCQKRPDCTSTSEKVQQGVNAKPCLKQLAVQVIMTWMDSYQDHERIQLTCLQSLPTILEDPSNRIAAQTDGLASIVLYNMAAFPADSLLQLTALHTLVVLLRPLGANEGTVNRATVHSQNSTSKSSRGIRSIDARGEQQRRNAAPCGDGATNGRRPSHRATSKRPVALLDATYEPRWEENGVRVMLDSLRRFSSDRYVQAMGCWAMVNAALYPSLKTSLLRLGGVYAVTNAMMLHPHVEAVQFRGLFALINLVIPDETKKDGDGSSIHSHIYQIARLTILAMKNFHTNKSILNRGCLVLRNLSLTPAFVNILASTPGCVDMLLHCRQVCPRDVLVQRSARTIMILVQRNATNKEGGERSGEKSSGSSFELTRPRMLGTSQTMGTSAGNPSSSSLMLPAAAPVPLGFATMPNSAPTSTPPTQLPRPPF